MIGSAGDRVELRCFISRELTSRLAVIKHYCDMRICDMPGQVLVLDSFFPLITKEKRE